MDTANMEQARAWNGPEGTHWAEHGDRTGGGQTPLHDHLFGASAIGPGDHVLDIGCGTGETTRLAAKRAVDGFAAGIDLSVPMLALARRAAAAEGLRNVRFDEGDVQVYPFPPGRYDVAVSQFGVMFFADPVAAFANIGRALRPGGRLVFVCPREMIACEWYMVPMAALLGHAPRPDAGAQSGMFSLADPARIGELLTAAGFRGVASRPIDVPLYFGADAAEAADFFLGSGPVRAFRETNHQLTRTQARKALLAAVQPYQRADGVWLPGAHWLVSAVRP